MALTFDDGPLNGTRNVLELQRERGFRHVFASSSEVYGEADAEAAPPVLDLALTEPLERTLEDVLEPRHDEADADDSFTVLSFGCLVELGSPCNRYASSVD